MVANGHDLAIEKKEKSSKIRRKRSKSQSKRKSSRKESSNHKSDDVHTNGDKIHVEIKDNWNSQEYHDQDDTPDIYDEMDELKGEEGAPKAPSRHSKLSFGLPFDVAERILRWQRKLHSNQILYFILPCRTFRIVQKRKKELKEIRIRERSFKAFTSSETYYIIGCKH